MILRESSPLISFYVDLFCIFLDVLLHHCTNFQWKTKECDESVCIVVVILITGCETCKRLAVQ